MVFDLLVIGGGSAGVRMARWSASLGAKVALCERDRLGGTCVIRGCVPKKIMMYASQFADEWEASSQFGWSPAQAEFHWERLIRQRDAEVSRLSHIYEGLLKDRQVDLFMGDASFVDEHRVAVGDRVIEAKKIVIAVGGRPFIPSLPGSRYAITSQDFFQLAKRPKSMLVYGAGFIALEFSSILQGLGTQVDLVFRGERVLSSLDEDISLFLEQELSRKKIPICKSREIKSIEKTDEDGGECLSVHFSDGGRKNYEQVLFATGRVPFLEGLNLAAAGVAVDEGGRIQVDSGFRSSCPHIFALGDCANSLNLTPVATREGTLLAEKLFNAKAQLQDPLMSYDLVPWAVFTRPPLAAVGLTEQLARAQGLNIEIFKADFRPLKHTISGLEERSLIKCIVDKGSRKVVGAFMVGENAPEIMQGVAIALQAGATKEDFDRTVGIHPTSAEEFCTLRNPVN